MAGETEEPVMVRSEPLLDPVTLGLSATTRTRYVAPVVIKFGMVALIVPAEVELILPTTVGLAKLPVASDNSTLKVLPGLKVPVNV